MGDVQADAEEAQVMEIPAPTQHLAGRAIGRRLADGLPSANNLRKTEAAWHEYRGLLAWRWDHPG
jgi:hypothetical protein